MGTLLETQERNGIESQLSVTRQQGRAARESYERLKGIFAAKTSQFAELDAQCHAALARVSQHRGQRPDDMGFPSQAEIDSWTVEDSRLEQEFLTLAAKRKALNEEIEPMRMDLVKAANVLNQLMAVERNLVNKLTPPTGEAYLRYV